MYLWKCQIKERGFSEIKEEEYSTYELTKKNYVDTYLSPSIAYSHCGWDKCTYVIMYNDLTRAEFVILWSGYDARYINVTCDSLGSMSQEVWENVFN